MLLIFAILALFLSSVAESSGIVDDDKKPAGALIAVEFFGRIGFMLDEIPYRDGARSKAEKFILNHVSEADWIERVHHQLKHSEFVQVFRSSFKPGKRQLTFPPQPLWRITFTEKPKKYKIHGHDYISRQYRFYSVLLGSASSVNASEPTLVPIGGKYSDTWVGPVDPEQLYQRVGYACANEAGFPSDTVNSENMWVYFDYHCMPEPFIPPEERTPELNNVRCHWTNFPTESCMTVLKNKVGYTTITMTWTRLPWSEEVAAKWRYGEQTSSVGADLEGYQKNLIDDRLVVYKFFDSDSCALQEGAADSGIGGCIDKPGWRRLLMFTSTGINIGRGDLVFGDVKNLLVSSTNLFVFDSCHKHYHFQHYGTFRYGPKKGRKVGFCLESTWRYHNNEWVGFNSPFDNCFYQGISAGWGDDYVQGLDCQWFDVTSMSPGTYNISEKLNPDSFLCEGKPLLDANDTQLFVPTNFSTLVTNKTVYRQACDFTKDYDKNNVDTYPYTLTKMDSFVTLPCRRQAQLSPLKNCEFQLAYDMLPCESGKQAKIKLNKLKCKNCSAIIRLCESSVELGHSTMCEHRQSLAHAVMVGDGKELTLNFKCPGRRSSSEPGGYFSILTSSLLPGEKIPKVSICTE